MRSEITAAIAQQSLRALVLNIFATGVQMKELSTAETNAANSQSHR
jgi:hypothetical protein